MSHTYTQNIIHLVFSTKNRAKTIPLSLQPKLHSYLAGICKREQIFVHALGGTDDHLHCLLQLPATLSVAKTANLLKANSSRWLRQTCRTFTWQEGYAAFSVSASQLPAVSRYVQSQEAHHRKMNFDQEFLALLRKHGVNHDPQFVLG